MFIFFCLSCRYFGAAKDLPGVRELFQQEGNGYNHAAYFRI